MMGAKQGHPFVWLGAAFVVIVLLAAMPVISALISGAIAGALGCQLNEGGAPPCPLMGVDLGEMRPFRERAAACGEQPKEDDRRQRPCIHFQRTHLSFELRQAHVALLTDDRAIERSP